MLEIFNFVYPLRTIPKRRERREFVSLNFGRLILKIFIKPAKRAGTLIEKAQNEIDECNSSSDRGDALTLKLPTMNVFLFLPHLVRIFEIRKRKDELIYEFN